MHHGIGHMVTGGLPRRGVDITSPLGQDHNPPPNMTTTAPLDRTTTSPWPGSMVTTPPPPNIQYASYWNAFLFFYAIIFWQETKKLWL